MQAGNSICLLVGVYCEFQSEIALWFNVCEQLLCSLSLTVIRAMYCVRERVGFIHKGQLGCIIIPFVVQMVIEFTQGTVGVNRSFLVQLVIPSRGSGCTHHQYFKGQWGVLTIHISDGH